MPIKNTAFYLKYRPQSLNDLVGQEIVKKTLTAAFENNKLSHAYLLVGPRGTGKTSTARILAKMVNCEKSSVISHQSSDKIPCNECVTCLSITDGSNLDLIEIDAASNRGIEDIRSLREKVKLSPTAAHKKIYIIDEVHMLTTEAFNALLKTLEEPPAHAIFILATTEGVKIPQTIMSRVQKLDFKLATQSELLQALQKIVVSEKIDIDDMGLKLLIKRSDGSFRDGVKLLDQVSSIEGKITLEVLEKFLKSSNFEKIIELVENLSRKNATKVLTQIIKEVEEGVDIKELVLSLMEILRNMVFIKNELGDSLVKVNYSEEDYESLIKISQDFTNYDLVNSLNVLQKAIEQMKTSSIPSLPLELAVVEMTQSVILSERSESKDLSPMQDSNELRDSSRLDSIESKRALIVQNDRKEKIHPQSSIIESLPSTIDHPLSNDSSDILKLKEKWTFVLETIRPYNFSLEALLRSINVTECSEQEVIMEVPYSFHQRILEAPKNRDILESILSEILGRQIRISTVLGNRSTKREDIANIEVAADDEIIRVAAEIFSSDSVN